MVGYVCTIKCATITRELKVAATWGLDHFVAIDTVQVTYISDLRFSPRKPQYSTTSGYQMRHYNSRTKGRSDLGFGPICSY